MTTRAELLRALQLELGQRADLEFALLFGSHADGQPRPDSDVDVAVMPRGEWSFAAELDLQARLAQVLGAPVDLVRLDQASLLLAWEVVRKGVHICGNPERVARYQAEVALEHADAGPALQRAARHYARRVAELGVPR